MSENKKRIRSKKPRNAPTELSTQKPCGRHLYDIDESKQITDPRFREECGEIDKVGFIKNYAFLQENRQAEIKAIQKQMKDNPELADNPEYKRKLQSLRDQMKTNAQKISDVNDSLQWHKEERARIAEGKKPYWQGKSDLKLLKQKKKYDELTKTGRLESYINKRRKKMLAKDKKAGI